MTPEIVVAGGGLAGAAAGCVLAEAGKDVLIIEREAAPAHKICGEFLSTEAQAYLHRLGFDVGALGGHQINRMRLSRGDEHIETDLPFSGLGLSRRVLDEALLLHAEARGAKLLRGKSISSVSGTGTVHLTDGKVLSPKVVFLATGKHDVRGVRRASAAAEALVGFKMHFWLSAPARRQLENFVSLILFRDGYAGIQLIEEAKANLCFLVKQQHVRRCGKWPALLRDLCQESRFLAGLMDGATSLIPQPLTIFRVPYGYVYQPVDGVAQTIFRLGDQAAVIPSFTGDGMAIALHSALLSSSLYLRGAGARQYHTQFARDVSVQIRLAGVLYGLANHRFTSSIFFQALRLLPSMLSVGASLTRIPERARLGVS